MECPLRAPGHQDAAKTRALLRFERCTMEESKYLVDHGRPRQTPSLPSPNQPVLMLDN